MSSTRLTRAKSRLATAHLTKENVAEARRDYEYEFARDRIVTSRKRRDLPFTDDQVRDLTALLTGEVNK